MSTPHTGPAGRWAGALACWVCAGAAWATALNANPDSAPLRLAVERNYPPFVFVTGQQPAQGLSIDVLQQLQHSTGLRIQPQTAAALPHLLADLREGRADLITSLSPTPERAAFLEFTRPYLLVPAVLVLRRDRAPGNASAALKALQGRAVAVGQGYAVEAAMRKAYPQVAWQTVSDDTQALQGVASGQFEAAVTDAASAAYIMQTLGLHGLRSAGRVGFEYGLSLGIRQGQPGLRDWLDAAIGAMTPRQRQAIIDRWMHPLDAQAMEQTPTWPAWLGAGLVAAGLLLLGWGARPTPPDTPPHG